MATREYVVTVKKGIDWEEVHADLIEDTTSREGLDPNIVPMRPVAVAKLRQTNTRSTHYLLEPSEAEGLKNDTRILDVQSKTFGYLKPSVIQEGNFDRDRTNDTGASPKIYRTNYGLVLHTNQANIYNNSQNDPGVDYNYVLDGTGVDVVIMDTGIQPDHPEWQDANGVSRLKEINWYQESGISGAHPQNMYRDRNGHGTHVAGIVAGKTFGWAKNADIYVQRLSGLEPLLSEGVDTMPDEDCFDTLIAWHKAKTNNRPTVLNCSWVNVFTLYTTPNPMQIQDHPGLEVSGGTYRGTTHGRSARLQWQEDYGMPSTASMTFGATVDFPFRVTSTFASFESMIDAGIIVCFAAGNSDVKLDKLGGSDYENKIKITADSSKGSTGPTGFTLPDGDHEFTYMKPDVVEPSTSSPSLLVGCVNKHSKDANFERKWNYSNCGPAVNIYAAGDHIYSALSTSHQQSQINDSTYRFDTSNNHSTSFKESFMSGTSMAAPQVAGMAALLLQAHPDWTPLQVMNWFQNNAHNNLYSTGLNNDSTVRDSIRGSEQRVAYFPLTGQKVYSISAS